MKKSIIIASLALIILATATASAYKLPYNIYVPKPYIPGGIPQIPQVPVTRPILTPDDVDRIAQQTNFTPPANTDLDFWNNIDNYINNNPLCRPVPPRPITPLCPFQPAYPVFPIFRP